MFTTINLIAVLIVLLAIPINARHNGTSSDNSASSEESVVSGQQSNRFGQFENMPNRRGNAAGGQRANPFEQRGNFVEQPGFPFGQRGNPFGQSDNQAGFGGMPFGERGYGDRQGGVDLFGQRGNQF